MPAGADNPTERLFQQVETLFSTEYSVAPVFCGSLSDFAEKKQELQHLSFYNKGEVIFYVGKKKEGRAAGALD